MTHMHLMYMVYSELIVDIISSELPESVIVGLPPDMPYWTCQIGDYRDNWGKYLQTRNEVNFHVNPYPEYVGQISISNSNLRRVVEDVMASSVDFELGARIVYSVNCIFLLIIVARLFDRMLKPDALITALLAIVNNNQSRIVTHLCDMPLLISREIAVSKESFDYFKNVYSHWEKNKKNKEFYVEEYAKAALFNKRLGYILEVMRQVCYSSKRVIAVVPKFWVKHIESQWHNKLIPKASKLRDFLKLPKFAHNEVASERIEKHIMIELMLEPFITEFFIFNQVFPFNYSNLFGGKLPNEGRYIQLWKDCLNTYHKLKDL